MSGNIVAQLMIRSLGGRKYRELARFLRAINLFGSFYIEFADDLFATAVKWKKKSGTGK